MCDNVSESVVGLSRCHVRTPARPRLIQHPPPPFLKAHWLRVGFLYPVIWEGREPVGVHGRGLGGHGAAQVTGGGTAWPLL